jgi:membrane-associated phospholipid phosphatase
MVWRMRHHLVLKFLGISGFMWVFFTLYFHLLRHPGREVLVMPLTALDQALPFQPMAFVAYASLWIYVGFPVGLMLSLREVLRYGAWMGGLCAVGLSCFYLWPTAVPPYDFSGVDLSGSGMRLLQGVDAAGNACPSLHVATAVFTAVWVHRLLQLTAARALWFVANAVWAGLIVYSTMAIKQHVALDVAAGTLLALAFAWPSVRWHPPAVR